MANFDLKYGSQVVHGDARALTRLPAYAAADMPIAEALQLLMNRVAGLLTGVRRGEHRYLVNQYVKAATALGDTYLVSWRCYDSSYRTRARRFESLATGAGLPEPVRRAVSEAYTLKLRPDYGAIPEILEAIRRLFPALSRRLCDLVADCGGARTATLAAAMSEYFGLSLVADLESDNRRLLRRPEIRAIAHEGCGCGPLRQMVYSVLPLMLDAALQDGPEVICDTRSWSASQWLDLPPAVAGREQWQAVTDRMVAAWFAIIH